MHAAATSTIRVLSEDAISQIAAGELIERPASIVKELVENSIDAGSTVITVDILDGGKQMIRVSDNGLGIPPEDLRLAFERHATSKLRTADDLMQIRTMGFRGEALPSIAAVSSVKVKTMCLGRTTGAELTLTNGLPGVLEDVALSPGTIIEAADLFSKIPVRNKFLKTSTTEFSHISRVVQNLALGAPAVHVTLTHNGKGISDFPARPSMRERVLQVYGASFIDRCLELSSDAEGMSIWGLLAKPEQVTSSRTPQEMILNGRWVKSQMIVHAVYEAYRMRIPKDRHPTFVLTLDLDPKRVDVNVHPTKREVRFLDREAIHRAIFLTIKHGLGSLAGRDQAASSAQGAAVSFAPQYGWGPSTDRGMVSPLSAQGTLHVSNGETVSEIDLPMVAEERPHDHHGVVPRLGINACDVRPLGQLNQTYIVANVDLDDWHGLKVIDQHTAHERVLFDRLVQQTKTNTIPTQGLLFAPVIELQASHAELINEHCAELRALGLEIERFGVHAFRIRAVPSFLAHTDVYALLSEIAEEIAEGVFDTAEDSSVSVEKKTHKVLATMACHGAVKANQTLPADEMKHLVEDWVGAGMPTTCPHGRRVVMQLSIAELDRIFRRA